jgi:hypothetical protein
LFAAALCALVAALFPGPASAGQPTIDRHPVYGGMDAFFGDCPDTEETPPVGTVCVDNYMIVWRGYDVIGGGSIAPAKAPWYAFAVTVRLEVTGPEEITETLLRQGAAELDGEASVDTVHLGDGSAAFRLPMSDGSTFEFAGTWRAIGDRVVWGNDGPATGAPRHFVDRCTTFNGLGHQKFRPASMTGTLNGQSVHSYTVGVYAGIFNNRFLYIDVPHGGCG